LIIPPPNLSFEKKKKILANIEAVGAKNVKIIQKEAFLMRFIPFLMPFSPFSSPLVQFISQHQPFLPLVHSILIFKIYPCSKVEAFLLFLGFFFLRTIVIF